MGISEIENRIHVCEEILFNEYDFVYGNRKDEEVVFVYWNIKTDKESSPIRRTYRYALELARSRRRDGRYKNFEFIITK